MHTPHAQAHDLHRRQRAGLHAEPRQNAECRAEQPDTRTPAVRVFFDYSGRHCDAWGGVVDLHDGRTLRIGGEIKPDPRGQVRSNEELAYLQCRTVVERLGIRGAVYYTDERGLADRRNLTYISREHPLHRRAHDHAGWVRRELEREETPQDRARRQGLNVNLGHLSEGEQREAIRQHARLSRELVKTRQSAMNKQRNSRSWQKCWQRAQDIEGELRALIAHLRAGGRPLMSDAA